MKIVRWIALLILLMGFSATVIAQEAEPTPDDTIEIDLDEVGEDAENLAEDAVDATQNVAETTLTALESLADRLAVAPNSGLMQVLFVVGGAVLLLLGWRIYDEIIILAGILVGAALGAAVVGNSSMVVEIAGVLIGGLIGALIAIFLYYFMVFIIGAYVGLLFTYAAVQTLGLSVSDVALIIGALVGGLLLLGLSAQLIIILSAIVGAQMIVLALGLTAEWVIILAVIGIVVQFITLRAMNINLRTRPRRNYRKILFG
jgi:hypothetical protein